MSEIEPNADMLEGFRDGYDRNCPEPSANRSASYRHGFQMGRNDINNLPPSRNPAKTVADNRAKADQAMREDDNR